MAQGKNAYIRYKVLDRCFRDSRRRYYIEDLVEACNEELSNYDGSSVSERTIRDDISFMQREAGGGIPLVKKYDGHKAYYMYSDRNFSIMDIPMSQSEAEMLSDTIQMLSRFKGLPNQEWLNATLVQMKSTFNIGQAKASYVSFSQNEDLKGLKYFTPLYEAIASQQVVSLEYHQFGRPSYNRIIHPYQLRQYNNRWFLVGWEPAVAAKIPLVVIPLDRIDDYKILDKEHFVSYQGDIDECFKDIVGVSLKFNESCSHIVFKAYPPTSSYIETKPIHHSQRIVERHEDYTIFSLDLIPNYEFETIMMSYADNCEILEPQDLKESLVCRAKNIIKFNVGQ